MSEGYEFEVGHTSTKAFIVSVIDPENDDAVVASCSYDKAEAIAEMEQFIEQADAALSQLKALPEQKICRTLPPKYRTISGDADPAIAHQVFGQMRDEVEEEVNAKGYEIKDITISIQDRYQDLGSLLSTEKLLKMEVEVWLTPEQDAIFQALP